MAVSLGPFIMCFLTVLFLTAYVYVTIYVKKDVPHRGMKFVFVGIALILIRMLIPFDFPFTVTITSYKILPPISRVLFRYIGNTEIGLAEILFFIWIVVAVIKVIKLFWCQIRYRNYLRPFIIKDWSKNQQLHEVLQMCGATSLQACVLPQAIAPAIVGLLHPVLVLPEEEFTSKELYYICRHEVEHYRNHDLWLKFFLNLVICTQWFNPLVYIMDRELTLAFELSNDQVVLADCDELECTEYAECIVKVARYQSREFSDKNALSFTKKNHSNIKTRLQFIISKNRNSGKKNKYSVAANYILVAAAVLISVLFVPEAYVPDGLEQEKQTYIKNDTSYFLKEGKEKYRLYMNGKYISTFDAIPKELEYIPVIEKENKSEK